MKHALGLFLLFGLCFGVQSVTSENVYSVGTSSVTTINIPMMGYVGLESNDNDVYVSWYGKDPSVYGMYLPAKILVDSQEVFAVNQKITLKAVSSPAKVYFHEYIK